MVVLAPLVSGLAGGVTLPAWMELIAKTLDPNRRASAMAIRQVIAATIGLASGAVISAVLFHWPGVAGYGVLHLIAFGFLMLSLTVLTLAREEAVHPGHHGPAVGLLDNLRSIPGIVRGTSGLARFLVVRVVSCGIFIALPFMAIHALDTSEHPDSYLGVLVAAQMVGGILGNVVGGVLGDRTGTRHTALLGIGSLLTLCLLTPWCTGWWQFVAGFGLFGFGFNAMRVGMVTLGLELAPVSKRGTAVATIGWCMAGGLLASTLIGGLLWGATGRFVLLCVVGAACMGAAFLLLLGVPDPRHRQMPLSIRA
jgi:MFS family permease